MTSHSEVENDKIAFLRRQRQTRSYSTDPVSDESLSNILEVARWTGSAGNKQRWKLVVIRDPELIQHLAAVKSDTGWVANASIAILVLTEGATAETGRFDAGRLSERMLLAAQAEGLGAGIIAFGDTASNTAVRELLSVPDGLWIFAAVVIGHSAQGSSATGSSRGGRKSLDEIVIRNRFH